MIKRKNIEKLLKKLPDHVKIDLSTYVNLTTKAKFIDNEFGEWWTKPTYVLKGCGHPRRKYYNIGKNKTLTLDDINKKLPKYVQIDFSTYKGVSIKAKFIDEEHGEWWALPSNVFNSHGHPNRGKDISAEKQRTKVSEITDKLPENLTMVISTYKNMNTNALFIDSEYGEWWAPPIRVLRTLRHPKKTFESRYLKIDEILKRLEPHIQLDVSTYTNVTTKARFIDEKYGEWWVMPYKVFQGSNHPSRYANNSKSELELLKFIGDITKSDNIGKFKKKYEIDVYVPDFEIGFEYHGLYWHNSDNTEKNYHMDKRIYFHGMDITLIQIYADEWAHKSDIVKSIIKSKLGMSDTKYYARTLSIKDVLSKEASGFLKENHLMGEYKSAKHVGLFDKDVLVSLISYKKHKDGIDISRFCNKLNSSVAGGLSRLLKEIERRESPKFIQSWVDLRYGTGDSLLSVGFEYSHASLGWKWTDNHMTYNRLYCRANMDQRKLSEKEHAEEMKLVKIYDAGQALFIKKF